ncbi:MAG: AIM24 family protein [Nitrosopumilus sp.]
MQIGLTGNILGEIEVIHIDGEFIVQSGLFVGSNSQLTLDTKWQGFTKGIFGSNLFMLKTVGTGDMFVNAWGVIVKTCLETGEKMILDNY